MIASRRIRVPDVYGLPPDSRTLSWESVRERIEKSPHYWLCTIDASGSPNPRPVDAVWLDERLLFGGDPATRWMRNLASNPRASINLEDGQSAVILQGAVEKHTLERAEAERAAGASNEKYGFEQTVEMWMSDAICAFRPTVVLAWSTLFEDGTRFDFS